MQIIVKWVLITVSVLLSVFCLCMVWNKILEFFLGYKIYWAVKYMCELLSPIAIVLLIFKATYKHLEIKLYFYQKYIKTKKNI